MTRRTTAAIRKDYLFAIILFAYIALYIATIHSYGVPFDEAQGESFLGDRYFSFLTSGEWRHLDFNTRSIEIYKNSDHPDYFLKRDYAVRHAHHIWGFGHTLASASKWLFYSVLGVFEPVDAQHLSVGITVFFLFIGIYLFCSHWLTPQIGIWAVIILMLHPRFWAHSHYNTKDIPHAVFYSLTLLSYIHGVYRKSIFLLAFSALLWGVSLSIKANAFFLIIVTSLFLIGVFLEEREDKYEIIKRAIIPSLLLLPISVLISILLWPYLLVDFPNHIIMYLRFLLDRGLEGTPYWNLDPIKNAIFTTPIPVLILGTIGVILVLFSVKKSKFKAGLSFAFLGWMTTPVLRVSMPYARDFDGIRHWIEFLPGLAILAGIGAEGLIKLISDVTKKDLKLIGRITLFSLMIPILYWNIKNHPYQYVYYNNLIGGLGGAQKSKMPEATDYWAVSYREALGWLNKNAPKSSRLYMAFCEHTVFYSPKSWRRDDIKLRKMKNLNLDKIKAKDFNNPTFLLYATRYSHLPKWLRNYNFSEDSLVHSAIVDNGTVYFIYRIDNLE